MAQARCGAYFSWDTPFECISDKQECNGCPFKYKNYKK